MERKRGEHEEALREADNARDGVASLKKKVDEESRSCAKLREANAQLESALEEERERREGLGKDASSVSAQLQRAKGEAERLKKSLGECEKELAKSQEDLLKARSVHVELKAEVEKRKKGEELLLDEKEVLKGEVSTERDRAAGLDTDLLSASEEIEELKRTLKKLEEDLGSKEEETKGLTGRVKVEEATVVELKEQIDESRNEQRRIRDELKAEQEAMITSLGQLEARAASLSESEAEARAEVEILKQAVKRGEDEVKLQRGRVEVVEQREAAKSEALALLQSEMLTVVSERDTLRRKEQEQLAEVEQLIAESALKDADAEIREARHTNDMKKKQADLEALWDEKEVLKGDVSTERDRAAGLDSDLLSASEEIAELKRTLTRLVEELDGANSTIIKQETLLRDQELAGKRLNDELDGALAEQDRLSIKLTSLQDKAALSLGELERRSRTLLDQISASKQEFRDAEKEHYSLVGEHAEALDALDGILRIMGGHGGEEKGVGGIGIQIEAPESPMDVPEVERVIRVDGLVNGGPAEASGKVAVNDTLLEVDGQNLTGLHVADVRSLIVGPAGTPITLKGVRASDGRAYVVTLTRSGGMKQLYPTAGDAALKVMSELEGLRRGIADERNANALLGASCEELSKSETRLRERVGELEKVQVLLTTQVTELEKESHASSSEVLRLKDELEKTSIRMIDREEALENSLKEGQRVKSELEVSMRDTSQIKDELSEARKMLEDETYRMSAESAMLVDENSALRRSIDSLRELLAASEKEVLNAHEEHDRIVREMGRAMAEAKKVHAILAGNVDDVQIGGIGVSIEAPENPLEADESDDISVRVERLVEGGPAAVSGKIQVDDIILEVHGREVTGMDTESVKELITGVEGTPVTIKGKRADDGSKYVVTMVRSAGTTPLDHFVVGLSRESSRLAEAVLGEVAGLKASLADSANELSKTKAELARLGEGMVGTSGELAAAKAQLLECEGELAVQKGKGKSLAGQVISILHPELTFVIPEPTLCRQIFHFWHHERFRP